MGFLAQVGNDADPYQVLTNYNYGGNYNGIAWTHLERTRNNENLKPELTTSIELAWNPCFLIIEFHYTPPITMPQP